MSPVNWRGRYEGGGMVVTAKRWWSPKERRAARLAAKVTAHMVTTPEFKAARAEHERRMLNHLMFGDQDGPQRGSGWTRDGGL